MIDQPNSCRNLTDNLIKMMNSNMKPLKSLTHLELNLRGYLLIEMSLYIHFYSFHKITDIGVIDMSKNLKYLEKLTHFELNLTG